MAFSEHPPRPLQDLALERLRREGIDRVDMAFDIPEERDIDGQPINAEITWLRLDPPEDKEFSDLAKIEGKLYLPKDNANNELILFTPGFPGGNAGRFEQRYAKAFTDGGYAFYTVRHNGTSLVNGKVSAEILNSPQRMELAEQEGQEHLGGTREEGYRPDEIVDETLTPFLALQQRFEKIHLMGQSMGVAASYNTVRRLHDHPELTDKIGNIVGIAGAVGKSGEEDGVWDGMKMPMDELTDYELGYAEKVGLNFKLDRAGFQESMRRIAEKNDAMQVPEHIGNVLVYTPDDPLIAGPDRTEENSIANYGPPTKRKIIIRDESNLGAPKAHSMLWIKPENLLRAVQTKVSEGMHFIKVPKSTTGMMEKG